MEQQIMDEDIRWKQRFDNYQRALSHLSAAVDYADNEETNDLIQLGIVKAFELSFELAWNVMKDFLLMKGINGIIGSKDSVRFAFKEGLIANGQLWMNMIDDRNRATHIYDETLAETIVQKIIDYYYAELTSFEKKMGVYL
jgi:nucleotidyltransferase substrate binding protein (TIGR01987 family)